MPARQPDCLVRIFAADCCRFEGWIEKSCGLCPEPLPDGPVEVTNADMHAHFQTVAAKYLKYFPQDVGENTCRHLLGIALVQRAVKALTPALGARSSLQALLSLQANADSLQEHTYSDCKACMSKFPELVAATKKSMGGRPRKTRRQVPSAGAAAQRGVRLQSAAREHAMQRAHDRMMSASAAGAGAAATAPGAAAPMLCFN